LRVASHRSENIDSLQSEIRGAGKEPRIVGVDLLQGMSGGTSKVEGIGCPQMNRDGQAGEYCRNPVNYQLRKRQPINTSGFAIPLEFRHQLAQLALIDRPFPKFAMKCRDGFSLAMQAAGNGISGAECPHLFPACVSGIETDEVAGIEIEHQARSSRSSEMPIVLSVPRPVFPLASNFLKAADGLRREK